MFNNASLPCQISTDCTGNGGVLRQSIASITVEWPIQATPWKGRVVGVRRCGKWSAVEYQKAERALFWIDAQPKVLGVSFSD
jgi:hypothetical protein